MPPKKLVQIYFSLAFQHTDKYYQLPEIPTMPGNHSTPPSLSKSVVTRKLYNHFLNIRLHHPKMKTEAIVQGLLHQPVQNYAPPPTPPSNFPQVLKVVKLLNLFENKAEYKVNANLVLWAVVSKDLARTPQASLILSRYLEQRHRTQHALHTHQRL